MVEVLIIFFLFFLNGLFAMYEFALVSSSKARLESMAQKGSRSAVKTLKFLAEPEKILSTIQVGITLVGIVSGAFGGVALADDVAPLFEKLSLSPESAHKFSVIIVVALITFFSLIIGELVPKSLALNNPERIATALTPFITVLFKIAYPFIFFLTVTTRAITRLLGIKSKDNRAITEEELKFLLLQSSQQGVIDKEETQRIRDVFRFGDKRASEIMTHRKDVIFILKSDSREEVFERIANYHFSKYLLCETTIEDIIGVVAVKDILSLFTGEQPFDLTRVAAAPLFIPENLMADKVLELFRQQKTNFAVVVSEYGAVEGIITLHDLTETILGDLPEEFDDQELEVIERQDGSWLVDGAMNIDDFMDSFGILSYEDIENEGFTTIGGLAMHFLRKVPREGDSFQYKDLQFEVMDMDRSRVDKLMVTRIKPVDN
ncbi:MAG TPA: hemolysin family protein [Bacteroidales bacterium]|nr:hemolysin family protein [Bacteroidales bacterium]HNS46296.1 hemolysin family protein [Bacteroidales bacterium]